MNQIKISVIIPMYNVEEYINYTLDTLVNQTLQDIEIILIDDGSTDNTKSIAYDYTSKYKYIKIIEQQNSGPSKARNKGIQEAIGEYIVFVDSDDILPLDSLELRYNKAIEENADIVIGATHKFNSQKEWPMKTHFLGDGEKKLGYDSSILWTVGPCNKIFKTELIKEIKFPEDIKYAEDQVFVLNAYLRANKIYSINNVIYLYRMRENENNESLTEKRYSESNNVLRQIINVWNIVCKSIDLNVENKFIKNQIKVQYLERLSTADIWVPVKASIISKDYDKQKETLQMLIDLVDSLDKDVFNDQKKLPWILTKGITDKFLFIDAKNRELIVELITKVLKKLDANSIYKLHKEHDYYISCIERVAKTQSTRHIYEFLTRRRLRKLNKNIDEKINKLCTKSVFTISKVLPIKKDMVILATNKSGVLEGNLSSINKELSKYEDIKTIVYLNKPKRTKKELIKMYHNLARAKVIVLDDYYRQIYGYKFRSQTEVVQVWHACGAFKKFGFSSIGKGDSNSIEFERNAHSSYTSVITSSKEINKHYADAFNIDEDKVFNLGVARADLLFDKEYIEYTKIKLENMYPSIKNKKVITYAPTFRGGPKQRKNFKNELDYKSILDELGEEYVIILKLHPSVNEKSVIIDEEYEDRVLNLTKYKDVNEILMITDILISDYSSIIFEYSILEKPMMLFAYDIDDYLDERNFYYSYDELVPGPIVKTNDEIIDVIKNNDFDMNKILKFKNRFFDYKDSNSTKRICEFINNKIKN